MDGRNAKNVASRSRVAKESGSVMRFADGRLMARVGSERNT